MTFEVARDQLKAIVERVERLELEIKDLNADKSDIYKEARANGFDVKAIKQVVSKRKLDTTDREEADLVFETYWNAVHGINLVHARARENIEEFDAETGEVRDTKSVAKASGEQTEGTTGLQAAGPRREMRVGEAPALVSATSDDGRDSVERHAPISPETAEGPKVLDGRSQSQGKQAPSDVSRDEAGQNLTGNTNSPIAPASQGEAEAPSVESVSPETHGGSDANTGGSHVTASENAATHQAGGLVKIPPAAKHPALLLRPHCLHPGEEICGGSGRNHCRACAAAMREEEVA